ncbi:MAG: hypothetical protein J3K34DRAFT_419632 [Monoraphidium minutum]|nr:MAG: hypothetical protein J3K34DRAFT_419632 [Monoraphidium minutum]
MGAAAHWPTCVHGIGRRLWARPSPAQSPQRSPAPAAHGSRPPSARALLLQCGEGRLRRRAEMYGDQASSSRETQGKGEGSQVLGWKFQVLWPHVWPRASGGGRHQRAPALLPRLAARQREPPQRRHARGRRQQARVCGVGQVEVDRQGLELFKARQVLSQLVSDAAAKRSPVGAGGQHAPVGDGEGGQARQQRQRRNEVCGGGGRAAAA